MKKKERRRETRYAEIGRIDCATICPLPGVLRDISRSGFSGKFPNPVFAERDSEYVVFITLSHGEVLRTIELVSVPQWIVQKTSETHIGFRILRSPDSPVLELFINDLQKKMSADADVIDMLISDTGFVS